MLGSKFNKVQIFVLSDMTVRSVQTAQHRADVESMNKIRFFAHRLILERLKISSGITYIFNSHDPA